MRRFDFGMRRLSSTQAASCEKATTERCVCRCNGVLHGARRAPLSIIDGLDLNDPDLEPLIEWLKGLPEEDPSGVCPPATLAW